MRKSKILGRFPECEDESLDFDLNVHLNSVEKGLQKDASEFEMDWYDQTKSYCTSQPDFIEIKSILTEFRKRSDPRVPTDIYVWLQRPIRTVPKKPQFGAEIWY